MWLRERIKLEKRKHSLNLPKYVLIAYSYGREFDCFVVVNFDVDRDRSVQVVNDAVRHLVDKQHQATSHDQHPQHPENRESADQMWAKTLGERQHPWSVGIRENQV